MNNKQLLLPQSIQDVFKLLAAIPGEHRLVGSTIGLLLKQQPLTTYQDIDIVIFMDVKQLNVNQFLSLGFVQCPYNPKLFTAKTEQNTIDCYVEALSNESFIDSNALLRDFTIGCLYCDKKGYISDPSGHGLSDLRNKVLRTVISPMASFQKDPVRLLRAIKWMVKGYQPTPDLQEAAKNWAPDKMDMPHLHAVKRKHLASLNPDLQRHYGQLLQDYGLMQKLFKLRGSEDPDLALRQLKFVSHTKNFNPETHSAFTFFKKYPNSRQGLSRCAIEKARLLHPRVGEYDAYLKTRRQYLPHLEALDLALPKVRPGS
jgi:tRNA nucleotidyltransferase/poly(A) polymerase